MSDEHKMTSQDKLVLGITLAAIFGGIFILGFIGLIVNIFGLTKLNIQKLKIVLLIFLL